MPFFDQPGARQFYDISGDAGPWLTLINGHTRSSKDFKLLTRHVVAAGFRVLAVDNRGSGETTTTRPFTLADMAGDVVRIWDELGIAESHLLGISMGGLISQYLAHEHPERIDRLVLISTTSHPGLIDEGDEAGWGSDFEAIKRKMTRYFSETFLEKNRMLVDAMSKQILKQVVEGSFRADAQLQRDAIRGFDARPFLATIEAPTLIIHGREDRIIPPRAAEEIAARLPRARLQLIDGVGHLLLAEYAKPLYELVTTFIAGRASR